MLIVRARWPLTASKLHEAIAAQEVAIKYIKQARRYRQYIMNSKKYSAKEQAKFQLLLENLTEQYNLLRDKAPLCLEALIEILE